MKKINVLYVEANSDGTVGGSHYMLLDLISLLDKNKYNIHVMFYEKNFLFNKFTEKADFVHIFRKPRGINLTKNRTGMSYLFLKLVQVLLNTLFITFWPFIYFNFFLLSKKINIIHLNNTVFSGFEWVFAAKISNTKIITHERGIHINPPRQLFFAPSFHTKFFDYIFGVSESTKRNMLDLKVNLDDRYTTLYDRIDVSKLTSSVKRSRAEVMTEFKITENSKLIGIVGNIKRWKGQMTVVEAVKIVKDLNVTFHCLIIGDVAKSISDDLQYYDEIVNKIKEYGLQNNITLTGHRKDVPDLINSLDILIHASTLPEPFGMVILEGMALGKPVIASAIGGPLEIIVDKESGILCEPGNPKALADNIIDLFNNQEKCNQLGLGAKARIDNKFSHLDIPFIETLYSKLNNS
jgi:glycosyltransferase involved in cell wall biosynthesis